MSCFTGQRRKGRLRETSPSSADFIFDRPERLAKTLRQNLNLSTEGDGDEKAQVIFEDVKLTRGFLSGHRKVVESLEADLRATEKGNRIANHVTDSVYEAFYEDWSLLPRFLPAIRDRELVSSNPRDHSRPLS